MKYRLACGDIVVMHNDECDSYLRYYVDNTARYEMWQGTIDELALYIAQLACDVCTVERITDDGNKYKAITMIATPYGIYRPDETTFISESDFNEYIESRHVSVAGKSTTTYQQLLTLKQSVIHLLRTMFNSLFESK